MPEKGIDITESFQKVGEMVASYWNPKKYRSNDLSQETKENLAAFHKGFKTLSENPRYLMKPPIFLRLSFLINLAVYVLVFFALGIQSQPFTLFIIIYFIAGSITDAAASFSVGTLEILLATIFIFYGLNPALSGITAALVRSVTFGFPLILGYIIVQVVGAKKLRAPNPQEKPTTKNRQINLLSSS